MIENRSSFQEFQYDIVRNPEIFMQNRMEAHSDHDYLPEGGPSRYLLNGSWYFAWAKNYRAADRTFAQPDKDCRSWDTIRVPGLSRCRATAHHSMSIPSIPGMESRRSARDRFRKTTIRWAAMYVTLLFRKI